MDCPVLLPLVNDVLYQQDQQQHSASQLTQLNNKTGVAIVRDLPPFGKHLLKISKVDKIALACFQRERGFHKLI